MGQIFSSFIKNCNCSSKQPDEDQRITKLEMDIFNIKENHLYSILKDIVDIQKDITDIEKDIVEIKTDIKIILSKLK